MPLRPSAVACVAIVLASCSSSSSDGNGGPAPLPTATTTTAAPAATSVPRVPSGPTAVATSTPPPRSTTTDDQLTTSIVTTAATGATPTAVAATSSTSAAVTSTPVTSTAVTSTAVTSVTSTAVNPAYEPVPSPNVPRATHPVAADASFPDGTYYASISESGDPPASPGTVVFELVQLFTGPTCTTHFGEDDEDACVNDYGVETDPTHVVELALDDQYISVVDAATQQSYRISGAELNDLILGDVPGPGAPADYVYSGFGYLVTYEGGAVTRLEQWWTP